jgi:hypothetical protein
MLDMDPLRSLPSAPESEQELSEAVDQQLWSSYAWTAGALTLSIILAKFGVVPAQHRLRPLVGLGVLGAAADFYTGKRRAEPFRLRLEALQQQRLAARQQNIPPLH